MSTLSPPKARPAAATAAGVLGLVLVGVAVISVHDLAVSQGWTAGSTWTGAAVDRADGLTASVGVVAVGILLMLLGLWAVYLAIKPARRTHESSPTESDIWVTNGALTTLATSAAESTPGVASAKARTTRKRIAVTVQSDRPGAEKAVEANVRTAVEELSTRSITVKTEKVSYDS